MFRSIFLLLLLTWTVPAMASYVNDCTLRGVVVSEPKNESPDQWSFDFEVSLSKEGGRVDGSCAKIGEVIQVSLFVEKKTTIKKGEVLWLRDLYKDNKPGGSHRMFSLLTAQDE